MNRLVLFALVCARASAFGHQDEAPSTCAAPKVSVITDALVKNDGTVEGSSFWRLWAEGAAAAAADVDFRGFSRIAIEAFDLPGYLAAISEACDDADALVVSVPFESGTAEYDAADKAINDCLDRRPDVPIFSTAYDTYQNSRLYGYVGAENYALGQKCGRALMFTADEADPDNEPEANRDAVTGRNAPLAAPVPAAARRCPDGKCQVYWPASFAANAGIARLVAGMDQVLGKYGYAVEVIRPTVEEELSLFDPESGTLDFMRIYAGEVTIWPEFKDTTNGFTTLVSTVGSEFFPAHSKLGCGSVNPDEDAWQMGASPFRQGLAATNSAASAANLAAAGGRWASAKGNNEAIEQSESLTNVGEVFVAPVSQEQINGGYDVHEPYMRLAAVLSFAIYADDRVGGGSMRDVFDNTCWTEGYANEFGVPIDRLKQFYYSAGDNVAAIVHLRETAGDDIVAVVFRGTQGGTALTNWISNLDLRKKSVPCPGASPPEGLDCKYHNGFYTSFEGLVGVGLLDELRALVADITATTGKAPKTIFTGHSLGGAMAVIAAFEFNLRHGVDVFGLYTQGQPRAIETHTRNYLETLRTFPAWRDTWELDPVVRIPFDSTGFQHAGVETFGEGETYPGIFGTLSSWVLGDGTGQDGSLTYNKNLFNVDVGDHGRTGYQLLHGSTVVTPDATAPCAGDSLTPLDPGYDSCADKCAARTGSSRKKFYGNGPSCWLFGGDCDSNCMDGYCSYAPDSYDDYPSGWFDLECRFGIGGRICCCDQFQSNEVIFS
jgi:hypothetical protein